MTYEEAVRSIRPGRYHHFKGNEYEVVEIARHSETGEPMVVYRALYGDFGLWCRPADMWNEEVVKDGVTHRRFSEVGEHAALSHAEMNRELYLRQKQMLSGFLERGAISQAQFDQSMQDLSEKMGIDE